MALGQKTKVGIEKGDLIRSNSNSAIPLYTEPKETASIYDNAFRGDEIGFYSGKSTTTNGVTFYEVVPINSLNADGSPNFNGTRLYFDSMLPFTNEANPKYNYSGSGFSIEKAVGIGTSILTAIGGIFGIINGTNNTDQSDTPTNTKNNTPAQPQPEETWLQKNGLVLFGTILSLLGIGGVVYYATRDKKPKK